MMVIDMRTYMMVIHECHVLELRIRIRNKTQTAVTSVRLNKRRTKLKQEFSLLT